MTVSDIPSQEVILTWQDSTGKKAKTKLRIPTVGADPPALSTAASTLVADLIACSDAVVTDVRGVTIEANVLTDAVSSVRNARDKLIIEYADSYGGLHRMALPAPLSTFFLAASDIVNTSASIYTSLVTALEGNVKDKLGVAIVVISAWAERSRHLKKGQRLQAS